MWDRLFIYLFIFHYVGFAECAYQPLGDEVQAGSVLLPASRRGRFLANIARRQAVDGTGIKFNQDADRMNAEAKKKVDVLSEELLPYIIAEQERRITLYKRVMTAIQNGEKGVTIAEIRNKPPVIIRKGLLYRCPTNRAPREPDGSGGILCEDDLKPTPIMFESCLSAEDKELYVAENKYFFCNRHKVEGPDMPRNGTTVIGCAPCERTPLNYTTQKCALEDTDDVVVHYRYYPDRTYKFVSELDPLREVCDHWNPCQVGYIFSLPGPDQATPASELWHTDEDDSINEMVPLENLGHNYTTSMRLTVIPIAFVFVDIGHQYNRSVDATRIVPQRVNETIPENLSIDYKVLEKYVKVTIKFHPLLEENYNRYYIYFWHDSTQNKFLPIFLNLTQTQTKLTPLVLDAMPGQLLHPATVVYTCEQCTLEGVVLRATDGSFGNLERAKYNMHSMDEHKLVQFEFGTMKTSDFGDYFLIMRNDVGSEERIKAISIKVVYMDCIRKAVTVGKPVDMSTTYECTTINASCELVDVFCHGKSMLASGDVEHIATAKRIRLNIARFEDHNACVYVALFKIGDDLYRKDVAIIEKVALEMLLVDAPPERAPFEHNINYKCNHPDCRVNNVTLNGAPLETKTRRSSVDPMAYYSFGDGSVTINITEYSFLYEGIYQGVFAVGADLVTKTLMHIRSNAFKSRIEDASGRERIKEAPPEGDAEAGGQLRLKHLSPPRTRRSATDADKSTL